MSPVPIIHLGEERQNGVKFLVLGINARLGRARLEARTSRSRVRGVNRSARAIILWFLPLSHTRLHVVMRTTLLTENVQPEMSQFVNNMYRLICNNFSQNSFKKPISITKYPVRRPKTSTF